MGSPVEYGPEPERRPRFLVVFHCVTAGLNFPGQLGSDEEEIVYNLSDFGFQYNMPRMWGVDFRLEI